MGLIWTFFPPYIFFHQMYSQIKGIGWGNILEQQQQQQHIPNVFHLSLPGRSLVLPRSLLWTRVQDRPQVFTSFKNILILIRGITLYSEFAQIFVSFLFSPQFLNSWRWNIRILKTALEALVRGGEWLVIALCLNAGCCNHSFLYGKKNCLHLIVC